MVWRIARSLGTLRTQVNAMAPNRSKLSDGDRGDPLHAARASDHNPDPRGIVHAWDVTHDPGDGCDVDKIFASIIASGDRRVSYLIRNRRITQWQNGRLVWVGYDGSNPHTLHGHLSVTVAGEDDTRPWSIGGGGTYVPEDDLTAQFETDMRRWTTTVDKKFGDLWGRFGVRADGKDRLTDLWESVGEVRNILGVREDGKDRITDLWDQERATQAEIAKLAAQVEALQAKHP